MEEINIKEAIECLKGSSESIDEKIVIKGVSTDSRKIKNGDVFVALVGPSFDGHNFVDDCYKRGAVAAIVSRKVDSPCPQVVVEDTFIALKELSRYYRNRFTLPIIAVTGSTGKTSTKEMISSVLSEKFKVHKTQQNFNNEIGLPLTLFELDNSDEISVIEMGMNNLGEIGRLADIARPNIGVITNIGTAHIENLGSRENILKAKMEITSYFNSYNTLVVNGDDEYLSTLKDVDYKLIKVSIKGNGDYNGIEVVNLGEHGVEFKCIYRGEKHTFKTNVPGVHNVYNALCAIAISDIYGLTAEEIKRGILNFKPGKLRMDIISIDDIKIINDCYNANVDSMKAAIDVLSSYNGNRRIAVLGDMFELGNFSESAHREIGNYLKDKCDLLLAVGKDAEYIYLEAKDNIEAAYFTDKEKACEFLNNIIKSKDIILIKASRGMHMEYIANYVAEGRKRGI